MSIREGFYVLDSENSLIREKTAKRSFGSAARKKLVDISNLPKQPKSLAQDEKEQFASNITKEYIEQLQKENTALMKLLADRNKIIELSGNELQKLRINLQKVQQQNLQLAQANSQILVELNSSKDKLKGLQHELGCKNGLLKVKKLELEGNEKVRACQEIDNQVGTSKSEEARESSEVDRAESKHLNTNRNKQLKNLGSSTVKQVHLKEKTENRRVSSRRQSARFKSEEPEPAEDKFEVGTSTSEEARESSEPDRADNLQQSNSLDPPFFNQVQSKEKTENKRVSLRRQSTRFKPEEPEPDEDKLDLDNAKLPECSLHDDRMWEDCSTSARSSAQKDDKGGSSGTSDDSVREFQRLPLRRPSRLAAKKVQSYKEISLNVKMRRTE